MQKIAPLAVAVALTLAGTPGLAAAKPGVRHHNPIAHMAAGHAHGHVAGRASATAGPR
jgi:hypothetical protein